LNNEAGEKARENQVWGEKRAKFADKYGGDLASTIDSASMLSVSSEPSSDVVLARDWAVPRSAPAFIGCSEESKGPGGVVLLCVANTPMPCTLEARDASRQRVVVFTVLCVREKGWLKAPW
jgi:hypothetical protein